MAERPQLVVYGLSVQDLPVMDRGGKADPYLVIKAGSESQKTEVRKDTLTAQWDKQIFVGRHGFDVLAADSIIIECWDEDMFRDEFIGRALVDFADIKTRTMPTKTLTLDLLDDKREKRGTLNVALLMLNLPPPPAAAAAAAAATAGATKPAPAAVASTTTAPPPPSASSSSSSAAAAAAASLPPNTLRVRVIQARGLREKKPDALVRLLSDAGECRTRTVQANDAPEWDEVFLFPAPSRTSRVVLNIEGFRKLLRNTFLGAVQLVAGDFEGAGPRRRWYSLGNRDGIEGDGTRGEVEVMVAWEPSTTPAALPSSVDPASGAPRVGVATMDGQSGVVGEAITAGHSETEDERKAREDEEERKKMVLAGMELKRGDYKVLIHIHEVRQLKDEDANNSVDPCVRVQVLGQRQQTKTAWMTNSFVFDHLMYFDFKDLQPEEVERGQLAIRVFDVDRFSRDDLVGQYIVDLPYVYFRENHELHMRWVGITDPTNKRKRGLMGYVKISACVLGPGDKRKVWDPAEEARLEAEEREHGLDSVILMPPSIERRLEFLVITAHAAEDLMPMDRPQMGGLIRAGIDAFVQVDFAGNPPARSRWMSVKEKKEGDSLCVRWTTDNELWVPVFVPTMTTAVRVAVWDYDTASANDLVGTFFLNFRELRDASVPPRWVPIYGAPRSIDNAQATRMNEFGPVASHYRGRVLISARVESTPSPDEPEHVHAKTATPALPHPFPIKTRGLTLRALIVAGTDIPCRFNPICRVLGLGAGAEMAMELTIGPHSVATVPLRVDRGLVRWEKQLSITASFPSDPSQVPDVFLYLCKGAAADKARVCFKRWSAADLLSRRGAFDARLNPCVWWQLQEDAALDALADMQPTGSILGRIALGPVKDEAVDETWEDDIARAAEVASFEVRVHVYQARNLPAGDDTGSTDPYVRVTVGGESRETRRKEATISPQFYETLRFRVNLPVRSEYMPPILLQLYDYDMMTSDDFISELRFFLSAEEVIRNELRADGTHDLPAALPMPRWYPLSALGREDQGPQGELLLSVQLIKLPSEVAETPAVMSIMPETQEWFVEVLALGLRSMQPFLGLPIMNPRVEFDLGDRSKRAIQKRTKNANFPSGTDPNFCERILIPCRLPVNPVFAPTLNFTVRDRRLGGFHSPVVGTACISLDDKIPGTPQYRPPMGSIQTENLHVTEMSAEERAEPPIYPKSRREALDTEDGGDLTPGPSRARLFLTHEEDLRSSNTNEIQIDGVGTITVDGAVASGAGADAETTPASPPIISSIGSRRRINIPGRRHRSGSASTSTSAQSRRNQRVVYHSQSGGDDGQDDGDDDERQPFIGGLTLPPELAAAASPLLSVTQLDVTAGLGRTPTPQAAVAVPTAGAAAAAAAGVGGPDGVVMTTLRVDEGDVGMSPIGICDSMVAKAVGIDTSFLGRHLKQVDGAIGKDGTPLYHPDDKAAQYMRSRRVYEYGLEDVFVTSPFETIPIMRGQDVGRGHVFGWRLPSNKHRVGVFKGIVRVIKSPDIEPPASWNKVLEPKHYEVRAYVLDGMGLKPMDDNKRSDVYIRAQLGKQSQSTRDQYIPATIDPPIFKCLTFNALLPGPSRLDIQAWDYDTITSDDLIGRTIIDLEDRWFDPRWQALGTAFETGARLRPKPVEERHLWHPNSWSDTGTLRVWVDILDPSMAKAYPPVDIEPPPPREYECRVIIWRTWGVPSFDPLTDQNDLYVRCWLEGGTAQSTDVHLRCKRGRGSFNWRMKFPTTIPCKHPILHVQLWDRDYLDVSDLIAQAELSLGKHFEAARHRRGRYMVMDEIRNSFEGRTALLAVAAGDSEAADDDVASKAGVDRSAEDAPSSGGADAVAIPVLTSAVADAETEASRVASGAVEEVGAKAPAAADSTTGRADVLRRRVERRRAAMIAANRRAFAEGDEEKGAAVLDLADDADADADGDDDDDVVGGGSDPKSAASTAESRKLLAGSKDAATGKVTGPAPVVWWNPRTWRLWPWSTAVTDADSPEAEAEAAEAAEAAKATVTNIKTITGIPIHPRAENAAWLPMFMHYGKDDKGSKIMLPKPKYAGKVLMSVELVPADIAEAMPVGLGRSDPNADPHLPPPAGRMHFSLNPFYLGRECLGPRLFANCLLCLCLVALVLLLIFGAPFLNAVVTFVNSLPDGVDTFMAVLIAVTVLVPIAYICIRHIWCPSGPTILGEVASDNHLYLDLEQVTRAARDDPAKYGFTMAVPVAAIKEAAASPTTITPDAAPAAADAVSPVVTELRPATPAAAAAVAPATEPAVV